MVNNMAYVKGACTTHCIPISIIALYNIKNNLGKFTVYNYNV